MAKKPWYVTIPNPDALIAEATRPVNDARLKFASLARQSGTFQDEPQAVAAFMRAGTPFGVAQRAYADFRASTLSQRANTWQNAGYGPLMQPNTLNNEVKSQVQQQKQQLAQQGEQMRQQMIQPEEFSFLDKALMGISSLFSTQAQNAKDIGEHVVSTLGEIGTGIGSLVTVPAGMGAASREYDESERNRPAEIAKLRNEHPELTGAGNLELSTGLLSGIKDFARGLGTIVGVNDISDTQKQDMRKAGYDPDSWKSRYAYYYQSFNSKRKPVSDEDVRALKKEYDPRDVDLAREIVTSNYFDNPQANINSLSPEAKTFMASLQVDGAQKRQDLLRKMEDNSNLMFGGQIMKAAGAEQGSTEKMVTSALADVAVTWYADPLVVAGQGIKATRFAMYGIPADNISKVSTVIAASDPSNFKPVGRIANAWDGMVRDAEAIYQARKSGDVAEAGRLTERFHRLRPGTEQTLDALMATREGKISGIVVRDEAARAREALNAGGLREAQPFLYKLNEPGKEVAPLWTLGDGSAEASAKAREAVSNVLRDVVFHEAVSSGRPLYKGKVLMPGGMAVNGALRQTAANIKSWFRDTSKPLSQMLQDTKSGNVVLNGTSLSDDAGRTSMLLGRDAMDWVHENHNTGFAHSLSRAARYLESSYSGRTMIMASPEASETFRRWVVQWLPKRQAYALTAEFMAADPAKRFDIFRQSLEGTLQAQGLRNTPAARRITDQMLKGIVKDGDSPGVRVGVDEWYGVPEVNARQIGDREMAVALYPHQLAEGFTLPSLRETKRVVERASWLGYISGTLNNETADAITRAWKGLKTINPANPARQIIGEGYPLTWLNTPEAVAGAVQARRALKAPKLEQKIGEREVKQLAKGLPNELQPEEIRYIDAARRTGDLDQYREAVKDVLTQNGIGAQHAEVLEHLALGTDFVALSNGGPMSKLALAFGGPLDFVRRIRLRMADKHSLQSDFSSPLEQYLDADVMSQITSSNWNAFSAAADSYATGMENLVQQRYRETAEAVRNGFGYRPAKITNGYEWLGDKASITTPMWAAYLNRIMKDELPGTIMQELARNGLKQENKRMIKEFSDAAHSEAQKVLPNSPLMARMLAEREIRLKGPKPMGDESDVVDFARKLLMEDPMGEAMRTSSARMQYTSDGVFAADDALKHQAAMETATEWVTDMVYSMGGKVAPDGSYSFPKELFPLIDDLAQGKTITPDRLAKFGDEFKPEGLSAEAYLPDVGQAPGWRDRLADGISKMYGTVVANPVASMVSHPVFLANRRIAYQQLMPNLQHLVDEGMDIGTAAYYLETAANRRAKNLTFSIVDNPHEHSVASELSDNWAMFWRANEDFAKRVMRSTIMNPERMARANLLMNAAHHAGMFRIEKSTNEEGNDEYHSVFIMPGTALLARTMLDVGAKLGLVPEETIKYPQFRDFSSEVRFVNPGVANPLQVSVNPIVGIPFELVRTIFPSTTMDMDNFLTFINGGERTYAEGNLLDTFMPSALVRFVPLMNRDDSEGKVHSLATTASIYAEAAGVLPGEGSSADERARAMDALRATATNVAIWRALTGVFAPSAPRVSDPELGELNPALLAEGLSNVRGEWFELLKGMNQRFDDPATAYSEANVEWLRRHPEGKLIVNPEAFTTGSTQFKGSEQGANASITATQWMLDNLDWVKANRSIAFYFVPPDKDGEKSFDNIAYRAQLNNDLREHKSLEEFYNDVTTTADIAEYFKVVDARSQAKFAQPDAANRIDAQFYKWEAEWKRTHPLAAADLEKRKTPAFVHTVLAPALNDVASGASAIPGASSKLTPLVKEMYSDYEKYRLDYAKADKYSGITKAQVNKKWRELGDRKWKGSAVDRLWSDFSIYEDGS